MFTVTLYDKQSCPNLAELKKLPKDVNMSCLLGGKLIMSFYRNNELIGQVFADKFQFQEAYNAGYHLALAE